MNNKEIFELAVGNEISDELWNTMKEFRYMKQILRMIELARKDELRKIKEELENTGLFHEFWLASNGRLVVLTCDKEYWDFLWNGKINSKKNNM